MKATNQNRTPFILYHWSSCKALETSKDPQASIGYPQAKNLRDFSALEVPTVRVDQSNAA